MKKVLLSGIIVLSLISCSNGSKTGWSEENKNAFLKECTSGSQKSANLTEVQAKEYCDCMLGKLEAKYPNELSVTTVSDDEMNRFADSCNK